jgi:hypothetical protein
MIERQTEAVGFNPEPFQHNKLVLCSIDFFDLHGLKFVTFLVFPCMKREVVIGPHQKKEAPDQPDAPFYLKRSQRTVSKNHSLTRSSFFMTDFMKEDFSYHEHFRLLGE